MSDRKRILVNIAGLPSVQPPPEEPVATPCQFGCTAFGINPACPDHRFDTSSGTRATAARGLYIIAQMTEQRFGKRKFEPDDGQDRGGQPCLS